MQPLFDDLPGPFTGFEPVVVAFLQPAILLAQQNPVIEKIQRVGIAFTQRKPLCALDERLCNRQEQLVGML